MGTENPRPDKWDEMRDVLSRVAVGPAGSRDLTRQEAQEAMTWVLQGSTSDIQAGVFLIAERLKRETDEENLGFLDALVAASVRMLSGCSTRPVQGAAKYSSRCRSVFHAKVPTRPSSEIPRSARAPPSRRVRSAHSP